MKKFLVLFVSLTLLTLMNASAFDFGSATKTAKSSAESSGNTSVQSMAEKEIKKITQEIQTKTQEQLDKYKKIADKQIASIESSLKEVTKQVKFFENIKARIIGYMKIGGIIIAILSSGLLFLIFMMFRIFKMVKNAANLKFAFDHKEYERRLTALEKEIKLLKKK